MEVFPFGGHKMILEPEDERSKKKRRGKMKETRGKMKVELTAAVKNEWKEKAEIEEVIEEENVEKRGRAKRRKFRRTTNTGGGAENKDEISGSNNMGLDEKWKEKGKEKVLIIKKE